jgi:hypothetical protein
MKYLLLGIAALAFAVPAAAQNAPGVEAHAGHATPPPHGTKANKAADREQHEHMMKDGEKCCCEEMKDHHMQHEDGAGAR